MKICLFCPANSRNPPVLWVGKRRNHIGKRIEELFLLSRDVRTVALQLLGSLVLSIEALWLQTVVKARRLGPNNSRKARMYRFLHSDPL